MPGPTDVTITLGPTEYEWLRKEAERSGVAPADIVLGIVLTVAYGEIEQGPKDFLENWNA